MTSTSIAILMVSISSVLLSVLSLRHTKRLEDIEQQNELLERILKKVELMDCEPTFKIDASIFSQIMSEATHDNDEE